MKGRKEEIIDAAAKLFMQRGYNGTSIVEISNAVGLSNSSGLFSHFKGKGEIYKAVVDKYVIHAQTPKQKFGDCSHLSLKEFIEVYVAQVVATMNGLRQSIAGTDSKAANRYFSFMLESGYKQEDSAETALALNNEELELWQAMVERAKVVGEVLPHINSLDAARLFRYAFVGISYTYAIKNEVNAAQLRKLLDSLYNIIKK